MNEIDGNIDENIDFDHFIFLVGDMLYYYKDINKYFYNRLGKLLHDVICDEFEEEYRKLDIRNKINDILEI
jgi:hypothetical protein